MVTRKDMLKIKGISDVKLDKMIQAAEKLEVRQFYLINTELMILQSHKYYDKKKEESEE